MFDWHFAQIPGECRCTASALRPLRRRCTTFPPIRRRSSIAALRPLARLAFFGLLSIALMFADTRFRYLEGIRQVAAVALYPAAARGADARARRSRGSAPTSRPSATLERRERQRSSATSSRRRRRRRRPTALRDENAQPARAARHGKALSARRHRRRGPVHRPRSVHAESSSSTAAATPASRPATR